MPWNVSTEMSLKIDFVQKYLTGNAPMASLCDAFGISRKTGYKYLRRYKQGGIAELEDKRKLRTQRPCKFQEKTWELVFATKKQFPFLGPRKIIRLLERQYPQMAFPSISMAKLKLKERGLTTPSKTKRAKAAYPLALREYTAPNAIWCMDFKGWFITRDKKRYEPMTVLDGYSRYMLLCKPVKQVSYAFVREYLEEVFSLYGLPETIRTDNGTPFAASHSKGGLSKLGVWLLKLGVWPERIPYGKPYLNGRIERLHRTLSEAVIRRYNADYEMFVKYFEEFTVFYNTVRPHEELEDSPPASRYAPSERRYVGDHFIDYIAPAGCEFYQLNNKGFIRLHGELTYISEPLAYEYIELEEDFYGHYLSFLGYPLGYLEDYPTYKGKRKV